MSKNPIKPFWSWNDKLEKEEIKHQIEMMHQSEIEGFFMHARGGLSTEYMGEEWFDITKLCLDMADELGMDAWAYDENGWPSGFADGKVPKAGVEFQQKWLVCDTVKDKNSLPDNIIAFYSNDGKFNIQSQPLEGSIIVYYDINKYYLDTFNKDAVKCFIDNTHEKYYERFKDRFGTSLKGFFTDEPQYGNNGNIPWSTEFEKIFEENYGYSLVQNLPKLYFDIDGSAAFRSDFYNMVSDVFRESFIKQMYDWCENHGCKLTGHMMNEDSLTAQMRSTAGVMSCYEYFHEPGIDFLGRHIDKPLTPKQLGSVGFQLGRKTLTESFALSGWDVNLNELKWIAQWQFVNGVTMLCPHLEGYSLRGARKRDYPASLFTQLPWFADAYKDFAIYMTRLGELLDSGIDKAPLLMINMMQSAYVVQNPQNTARLEEMSNKLNYIVTELADRHILHHYGDEVLISKYASVENGKLRVGNCEYSAVLLPDLISLKATTVKLLTELANAGGSVFIIGEAPRLINGRENAEIIELNNKSIRIKDLKDLKKQDYTHFADITTDASENRNINYCEKLMSDGTTLYYLVNLSKEPQSVEFTVKGDYELSELDVPSGKATPLMCDYVDGKTTVALSFATYGSFVLSAKEGRKIIKKGIEPNSIRLNKIFRVAECSDNAITLDTAEYSIDGGEWNAQKALILLQRDLLALKKGCKIALRFRFFVENAANISKLSLCMENPEKYEIILNGYNIDFKDNGFFTDKSFRKTDISNYFKFGENIIELRTDFFQKENVYKTLFSPDIHESEINKLTFDTELESIYILGNFGVKSNDDFHCGALKSIFTGRSFCLTSPVKTVDISNITVQGYWFFSGKMLLKQNVTISKNEKERYVLSLKALYSPAAQLFVNGKKVGVFAFAPYTLDVTDFLVDGENEIAIRLLSGNRNLLGPHHKVYGEMDATSPASFTDEFDWATPPEYVEKQTWTDNYSFVLFGAEL